MVMEGSLVNAVNETGLHPATSMIELPWLSHNDVNEDKHRNKDNPDDNHNSRLIPKAQ
jgi:hypothetical protein